MVVVAQLAGIDMRSDRRRDYWMMHGWLAGWLRLGSCLGVPLLCDLKGLIMFSFLVHFSASMFSPV
jgi:hypothetical protein